MKKETDFRLRIIELSILLIGVIAASVLAYQQFDFDRQIVNEDYQPLLEAKGENNQIKLYNRGSRVVNLQNYKVEPSDKLYFSIYQHSVFPGDSIDLDIVNAINPYLNKEKPPEHLLYSLFFSAKMPQGENIIYQGVLPILVNYGDNSVQGVRILGGNKLIPVWELPVGNFADLVSSQK